MKNYTITKDQIVELSGYGITHILKRMIPDAFKKELELNKWYKYNKCLVNYQGDIRNLNRGYGFYSDKSWMNEYNLGYEPEKWTEATPQEVGTAFRNEAKRIGFIDGAKFKSFEHGNPIRTVRESGRLNFNMISNRLLISTPESEWDNYQSNPAIFEKGKWAQIIPQEKQLIPMEKALKIIAKKLKTSPDNIEIK